MPEEKHPLLNNPLWTFNKPAVGFRSHYVAVDLEGDDPQREVLTLEVACSCREEVIGDVRNVFRSRLTNWKEVQAASQRGWQTQRPAARALRTVDLTDPAGKEKPTELMLQWYGGFMVGPHVLDVKDFLRVCDVVIGPVAVLLSPWRPTGESWWRTDLELAARSRHGLRYVFWQGSDNWFLAHPATVAIATGLYRQCFHLCVAGKANEIIDTLSEEEVEEVMSTNSQKLALQLVQRTRPWIEVPCGGDCPNRGNYAFPLGTWRRLIRLQRAVRKHGYEEGLGQSFHGGWGTTLNPTSNVVLSGLHSFWGKEGAFTPYHRHLMKAGAPRRKTSDKPATRAS